VGRSCSITWRRTALILMSVGREYWRWVFMRCSVLYLRNATQKALHACGDARMPGTRSWCGVHSRRQCLHFRLLRRTAHERIPLQYGQMCGAICFGGRLLTFLTNDTFVAQYKHPPPFLVEEYLLNPKKSSTSVGLSN
jgi:hypothetical protein